MEMRAVLLPGLLAGLVGTGGMTAAMYLIDRWGLANAKMVVAIGSIVTRSRTNAVRAGLVMHLGAGLCFALVYAVLFLQLGVRGIGPAAGFGVVVGFVHGFAMSFILVIAVAEHHPLPEFREAGFSVAVAHVVGHVVYGALVGLVLGMSGILH
jgi:uncharacterized membrane protein YagU involved in acid resistance